MVGGSDPFYLKFWVKLTPLERNRRFSVDIRGLSAIAELLASNRTCDRTNVERKVTTTVVSFRLLVLRYGTAYQMMSPPLGPCQPSGAIRRHTYSAAVTTLSDTAVLTVTIVVLVVALLLRPL